MADKHAIIQTGTAWCSCRQDVSEAVGAHATLCRDAVLASESVYWKESTSGDMEEERELTEKPSELEHVFLYVQFNPAMSGILDIVLGKGSPHIRCMVGRPDDLKFRRVVLPRRGQDNIIALLDIDGMTRREPSLVGVDGGTDFGEGHEKSLEEDERVRFE